MLMKILVAIAALAFLTVFVVLGAMWWRLGLHLRRSNRTLENALAEIQPEQEQVDETDASPPSDLPNSVLSQSNNATKTRADLL
jgi:hypothetical protein